MSLQYEPVRLFTLIYALKAEENNSIFISNAAGIEEIK